MEIVVLYLVKIVRRLYAGRQNIYIKRRRRKTKSKRNNKGTALLCAIIHTTQPLLHFGTLELRQ
jgi:hypothetical protein